jgi:hypothetical protein
LCFFPVVDVVADRVVNARLADAPAVVAAFNATEALLVVVACVVIATAFVVENVVEIAAAIVVAALVVVRFVVCVVEAPCELA